MALSAADVRKARNWWLTEALKKPKKEANIHKVTLKTAIEDGDTWFDTAPLTGSGADNFVSFKADIAAAFKVNTDATQMRLLLASIWMARAGVLP